MKIIPINTDKVAVKSSYAGLGPSEVLMYSKFLTIQGEGPFAGKKSLFVRLAGCNFGDKSHHCAWCFPPSHRILTPNGSTSFGELALGDELFTLDDEGNVTTTVITNTVLQEVPWEDMVQLKISVDGHVKKLTCTKDHPINTSNRGFVPAGDLKRSDRIVHVEHGELARRNRSNNMVENNPSFNEAYKEKLAAFKRNGARLISKKPLTTSARRIIKPNGMVNVVTVSCGPHNTFIVEDMHTHNCDTKFFLDSGVPTHFETILMHLHDADCDLLVVTGGEPLLQPNIEKMIRYIQLHRPSVHIQFETNGTQTTTMKSILEFGDRVTVVCSPKASAKSGYVSVPPLPTKLVNTLKNFYYKFVMTADQTDPHGQLPAWAFEVPNRVYLSPMTVYQRNVGENEIASSWDLSLVDHASTRANYKRVAYLAMAYGFTVSIQMHTWLDME